MDKRNWTEIEQAKSAALEVLLHNVKGPYDGLPRTAAWGYPEPYTRDLMISILGVAVSKNEQLLTAMEKTLLTLAKNQSLRGNIPSLVHDPDNRGASDTTPLFLLAVGIFRKLTHKKDFLDQEVQKALTWMEYQSPTDEYLIAQQPTSDWRDEQWVLGYGLYVNTLTYSYLKILGYTERALGLQDAMEHFTITTPTNPEHLHEGMMLKQKPYYALWSYKIYNSERFDLLGNSLAILSGLASEKRADEIIKWIENYCDIMIQNTDLALKLAPNFFPFILPEDPDWIPRYTEYNLPGDYHNGGLWPFITALHIAALVRVGKLKLAREKLFLLTDLIKKSRNKDLEYGFNEWYKAQDGEPMGQDWQTWSASLYLYAAACVETNTTPFFIF
ncbi:amylo-alpha-1,6-glucosidase [Flavobacterium sp. LS1R49]|uniref:beta-fructofuranosidase n=1 Tax=Flavobacterium shii TaxID=2987687 RepID=A0A9X2ZBP9_9FLAO|nr:glycoside hydrolase 100 family protein [Flavobacterium shii]MCV9927530.1 amylo-alpha-1,6-glucosidase [Flavobacterium shii]